MKISDAIMIFFRQNSHENLPLPKLLNGLGGIHRSLFKISCTIANFTIRRTGRAAGEIDNRTFYTFELFTAFPSSTGNSIRNRVSHSRTRKSHFTRCTQDREGKLSQT